MACVSFYSIREIRRTRSSIPKLNDFYRVVEEDGKQFVELKENITMLIDAFGSRVAKSFKMSFLQGLGAQAKIEKGLKGAMANDIVENKMPLLNLAGDILGFNTKQYLSKHPEAIGQLIQLAGPLLQGKGLGNFMQPQNNPGGGM